jgi:hypothetical protein
MGPNISASPGITHLVRRLANAWTIGILLLPFTTAFCPALPWGPPIVLYHGQRELLFLRGKCSHEADHSPPSVVEFKNV